MLMVAVMTSTLELAIAKASRLPGSRQDMIGREILARIEALAAPCDIQVGIDELEAGPGSGSISRMLADAIASDAGG